MVAPTTADQLRETLASPAVADSDVGTLGMAGIGVAVTVAAGPAPSELDATTLYAYETPFVRPVSVTALSSGVATSAPLRRTW